ncbi:uncharacterized protein LOC125055623 isoform X4 [Pieris napi]|uniref:uncharacterized protein LOC125055623 isoform X4 n=1 Tax=Pieris napi TaxID=78633 RepID=UPI001FBA6D36|nr:uncharacterized protein LOC125055623 isoform X4 [Pieris napi]
MGYYCTVPQCTSLAGKTKNVKFHRFPRDDAMAMKWNIILKRMKPITKYSKVCSLHFTQADYNVTTMGQWKTLSKDAVPTQNLPKLNPDGTVMVIRKSRTSVKYKGDKKDENSQCHQEYYSIVKEELSMDSQTIKTELMSPDPTTEPQRVIAPQSSIVSTVFQLASRLQGFNSPEKPKTQDAIMQTDPLSDDESPGKYESPEYVYPDDYFKNKEYLPQTTEEYNKEAEKYALERKSSTFDSFQKTVDFTKEKNEENFGKDVYQKMDYLYYQDSAEMLRNQQQNIHMLQEQHRMNENQNFFDENHIKQEVEVYAEEDKCFEGKERAEELYENHTIMQQTEEEVKQEPENSNNNGSETVMQSQQFFNTHVQIPDPLYISRPGPELLIAKQNALAAHAQLWQNTKKRPFFYSDNNQCTTTPLMHRIYRESFSESHSW